MRSDCTPAHAGGPEGQWAAIGGITVPCLWTEGAVASGDAMGGLLGSDEWLGSLLSCLEAAKSEDQIQTVWGKGIRGMPQGKWIGLRGWHNTCGPLCPANVHRGHPPQRKPGGQVAHRAIGRVSAPHSLAPARDSSSSRSPRMVWPNVQPASRRL